MTSKAQKTITFRPIVDGDYEMLSQWWTDWKWKPVPKDMLPMDTGILVMADERPVCAGFIYKTNSSICWIDWIISDKNYTDKESRSECLSLLLHLLCDVAKEMGYKVGYALLKHEGLAERYEKHGFTKGDTYNIEMIKHL